VRKKKFVVASVRKRENYHSKNTKKLVNEKIIQKNNIQGVGRIFENLFFFFAKIKKSF
jgi:hypothetical protein